MAGKHRRTRAYLDDFKKTASGEYSYEGVLYYMEERETERKGVLMRLWFLLGGSGLLLLVCGCIPAEGMDHSAWALLPYAADWIAFAFVCDGVYRMTAGGNPLRAYVYEASVKKLPARLKILEICTALTAAGVLVCPALHGFTGKGMYTALFLCLEMLIFLAALKMEKLLGKVKWKKENSSAVRLNSNQKKNKNVVIIDTTDKK